jgi:phospholipase/carboxylesterase
MPTDFPAPSVALASPYDPSLPLVVLLHGRGSHEQEIIGLAGHLPAGASYAAVRAPIAEGGGFAWFANRGIGRPVAESLAATMQWFRAWLDGVAPEGRPVALVGFSVAPRSRAGCCSATPPAGRASASCTAPSPSTPASTPAPAGSAARTSS